MNPINVRDFGALGDETHDDGPAINAASLAARAARLPLYFPTGVYRTTVSLDLTGAAEGWHVYGDGNQSRIVGVLALPHPIVDTTGSAEIVMRGLQIMGAAGGAQTCCVLAAREHVTYFGSNHFEHCDLGGHVLVAALVNVSADLMRAYDCIFSGPVGVILSGPPVEGVTSAYRVIEDTVLGNSHHHFAACVFKPQAGAGLWQRGGAVTLDTCYGALSAGATCFVKADSPGGCLCYLRNCRTESDNAEPAKHVLWAAAGVSGGEVTGTYNVYGGPYIRIDPGVVLGNCLVDFQPVDVVEMFGGGGGLINSYVRNSKMLTATLGEMTFNNTVVQTGGSPWPTLPLNSPTKTNTWMGQVGTRIGRLDIGGGAPIMRHLRAAVWTDVPAIPAGGLLDVSVPLLGLTNKDAVSANPRNGSQAAGVTWAAYPAADNVRVRLFNPGAVAVAAKQWLFEVQGWQYA